MIITFKFALRGNKSTLLALNKNYQKDKHKNNGTCQTKHILTSNNPRDGLTTNIVIKSN